MTSPSARTSDHLTIALVSAAVLLFEIAVTRVLSVVLWYHFAFLAVSLAMLGLGVPGVWFALRGVGPRDLERALIASAIAVPASLIAMLQYGGPLPQRTAVAAVGIAVPMLALGSVVCILLIRASGAAIARMYGADLIGATAGALLVVPLMHMVPTPSILAGAALLPAFALVIAGRRGIGITLMVSVVALLAWQEPLRVHHTKLYSERRGHVLFEKWTPTARLTVFPNVFWVKDPDAAFGWGMGTKFAPRPLEQLWLEQDGSAGTPISRLAGPPETHEYLFFDATSVAYQLQPVARACVIGAGGGRDILTALASGAREVDAVELNPHIVDLVSRRFGSFSGDVYHLPGVRAVVSEGRSFLAGTSRRYGLIQISLVDSWAATAAGAFALSENYLYTVEAYRLFWNRLDEGGMISTTRWIAGDRMLETVRLGHLVAEALRQEGVARPEDHIAIVQGGRVATIVASRRPFAGAALEQLAAVCAERGFQQHWPPDPAASDPGIGPIFARGPDALRAYGIDLSAPRDDRPFFFHTVPIFARVDPAVLTLLSTNERSVGLLRFLMLGVVAVALVLFLAPFALRRSLPRGPGFWPGSAYFGLIGFAFLWVEIPLIQKTVLYLGHPSHATTVVLASMLLGAGLGSLASGRLRDGAIPAWGLLLVGVVSAVNFAIPTLFSGTLHSPWPARAAIAAGIAALLGSLMGAALPLGMRRFGDPAKPWFWAVNGVCGVAASVTSLGLSMTFGFTRVIWAGAAAYAMAVTLLAFARNRNSSHGPRP